MEDSKDYISDRLLACDRLFVLSGDAGALSDAYEQEIKKLKDSVDRRRYDELSEIIRLHDTIQSLSMQKSYLLGVRDGIALEKLVK